MSKQITIRNRQGEAVMVIDRAEWERTELDAEVRALRKELRYKMRDLRQLRDTHELEAP
jgi:PHD/YefM family antitoxin component YafN of YafNO toxin-antitoxin module